MTIRRPNHDDLPGITRVLEDTELFPAALLADMMAPFLDDPECTERWLVIDTPADGVAGFAYCRPEPLAEGAWNLLAIGVLANARGQGHGAQLIAQLERDLTNERLMIIETSSLDAFEATRAFYEGLGYELEATIRDYWAAGDDKIIFTKRFG